MWPKQCATGLDSSKLLASETRVIPSCLIDSDCGAAATGASIRGAVPMPADLFRRLTFSGVTF